eukprot:snap_masked-scaffold_22-processed-gene-3.0-mRNA-1 protein AED:1.00 eAED:1.00 QI:0/0/0/0/1/1/2/0/464
MILRFAKLVALALDNWTYILFAFLPVYFALPSSILTNVFFSYLLLEALFVIFSIWRKKSYQTKIYPDENQKLDELSRLKLFNDCLHSDDHEGRRKLVSEWFNGLPLDQIKYDNIEEWLSWAFYGIELSSLSEEEKKQVTFFSKKAIELGKAQDIIKPGFSKEASEQALLLNWLPVDMALRPLIYYFVVRFLFQTILTPLFLKLIGFKTYKEGNFPFHYYKQENNKSKKNPVIFFHGIGIGLLPYLLLIKQLIPVLANRDRDLILVEIHLVSQHIFPFMFKPQELTQSVKNIIGRYGYEKSVIAGHSFGSFVAAWLVKYSPEVIEHLILIDPVSLYVHHPKALKNMFVAKYEEIPRDDLLERLFHVIFRGDLFIQLSLKRQFFWWNYILFPEKILTVNKEIQTAIFLSGFDVMVPNDLIIKHFDLMKEGRKNFVVHEFKDCEHGMFIGKKELTQQFFDVIDGFVI